MVFPRHLVEVRIDFFRYGRLTRTVGKSKTQSKSISERNGVAARVHAHLGNFQDEILAFDYINSNVLNLNDIFRVKFC